MHPKSRAFFTCAILCLAACEEYDAPTAARSRGAGAAGAPTTTTAATPGPMVPPPPDRISERQVLDELEAIGTKDRITSSDFSRFLELFESARTDMAFKYLSAKAVHIALEQRGGARATMLRRLSRAQATANVTSGFTIGPQANAECHVDFDDPQWLADLPDQAQAMYAPYYAEPCPQFNAIRFEPMQHGHFHLAYEDPTIDCLDENGLFGRGEPGNCTALADPSAEPRRLISHDSYQTIRIIRQSVLGIPSTFSMVSFVNYGGEPVKFRYRKGAVWYQWGSLAGQTTWDVSAHVVDVDEVQITHASTNAPCGPDWEAGAPGGGCPPGGGPFTLDDFRINP